MATTDSKAKGPRGPQPAWLTDEATADALRTIVKMRVEDEASYAEIARSLKNVQTSRGGAWTTERIATYLSPEYRARMGGKDTPVRLLTDEQLERLEEVQTRLAKERGLPTPEEPRPQSEKPATWLEDIYCGSCGARLIAIGYHKSGHQHYCRKSVEDPGSQHPGTGRMVVTTQRVEECVVLILSTLAERAPDHPQLQKMLPMGNISSEVAAEVAGAVISIVSAGHVHHDEAGRSRPRRFVDVELKFDVAEQLGIAPTVSTALYYVQFRGERRVIIKPARHD